ncbi:ISAzo13 family transposase [Streptomyces fulvoviolaceus]|uniref:ISAzo13 family transposase n=1 Tax=Streptomyces fulvoviolaceus TaxID=285535 RepID=UPI0021C1B1DB|nr:ISAzo13 family transposase [Streptomyces fulvoviolaceus]MCT9084817.1 ISAzo13 family transposase [Streptomyces fulvoviolaceus]
MAARLGVLLPHLNERQRRLLLAAEARELGHGGIRAVSRAAGVSETTVRKGIAELADEPSPFPGGRIRRPGGGRKNAAAKDPGLLPALLALVEPDERGDPMSPLRWTTKSLRHLADELTKQGHRVSATTVGKLLRQNGFSLQGNAKTLEGNQHPDRDAQFHYINSQVKEHQAAGEPVISADTKKKEMIGRYHNPGREWRPKGEPIDVEDHSLFFRGEIQQVIPYGIYDIAANTGWVNVGVDHDTSAFAVASIRRWWDNRGKGDYPSAKRLLITADSGGSNSPRYRLWKSELAALAEETGLAITVCHFPPGTSKWNKVEHRLFSHITMNWRGRPLTSHEVVIKTIESTRTRSGLRVEAELDTRAYPIGVTVSKEYLESLPIQPHDTHSAWNYTIQPHGRCTAQTASRSPRVIQSEVLEMLSHPVLTGMTREDLVRLIELLAPAQEAKAEQRTYDRRGGKRRRAKGSGGMTVITPAARIVASLVYLREVCPMPVLGDLLGVSRSALQHATRETRVLFAEHNHTVRAITLRLSTAQAVREFVSSAGSLQEADPEEALRHPAITGMGVGELDAITARLATRYQARLQEIRHKRRGAEVKKDPGAVVYRKITDEGRVLAAIIAMRQVATRPTIAALFKVSPRTIGNALVELRPLLKEDGYNPAPVHRKQRFHSAEEVLRFVESLEESNAHTEP